MDVYHEAIVRMYVVEKLSSAQIAHCLSLSPSRVVRILNTEGVNRRSRSEATRCSYVTRFHKKEFTIKPVLTKEDEFLKLAGVMLYWGEGTKRGGTVAFANSDPAMVRVFAKFLREICGVDSERLHASIHYYEDHDVRELTEFWSKVTGIEPGQFNKPFLHPRIKPGSYKNLSKYGTISIRYADTNLLKVITEWMAQYASSLD